MRVTWVLRADTAAKSAKSIFFFVYGLGSFDKFDAENRWFKEDLAGFNHGYFRGIHDKCVIAVVFSVTSPEVTLRIKKLRKENQEMEHQKLDLGRKDTQGWNFG